MPCPKCHVGSVGPHSDLCSDCDYDAGKLSLRDNLVFGAGVLVVGVLVFHEAWRHPEGAHLPRVVLEVPAGTEVEVRRNGDLLGDQIRTEILHADAP